MKRTPASGTRPPAPAGDIALAPVRISPADGLLREVRPDDADGIRDLVCGLSPQARYFRFFASVAPPSTGLLRVLCGSTGADILLLTDPAGRIIGHGMAADAPADAATDIGLVITDQWQGHGLGALLLSTLLSRAASRGIAAVVLDVLPANTRMLGIIDRRWPDAPRTRTRDAIVIRAGITTRQAAASRPVPAAVSLWPRPDEQSGDLHAASRPAA